MYGRKGRKRAYSRKGAYSPAKRRRVSGASSAHGKTIVPFCLTFFQGFFARPGSKVFFRMQKRGAGPTQARATSPPPTLSEGKQHSSLTGSGSHSSGHSKAPSPSQVASAHSSQSSQTPSMTLEAVAHQLSRMAMMSSPQCTGDTGSSQLRLK